MVSQIIHVFALFQNNCSNKLVFSREYQMQQSLWSPFRWSCSMIIYRYKWKCSSLFLIQAILHNATHGFSFLSYKPRGFLYDKPTGRGLHVSEDPRQLHLRLSSWYLISLSASQLTHLRCFFWGLTPVLPWSLLKRTALLLLLCCRENICCHQVAIYHHVF